MNFWVLPTLFVTPIKFMDMVFYLTMCQSYVFETLGYWMDYVLKIKDPLNEWNVILLYYVMDFLNPKNYNYLKFSLIF
jgi:hypothetical protein